MREMFFDVLDASGIRNIDPNRPGSDVAFIGFAKFGWAPSDADLAALRMRVLGEYRECHARIEGLFPHMTPDVKKRIKSADALIRGWLERPSRDKSVPPSLDVARDRAAAAFDALAEVLDLAASGAGITRIVPDTNALMNNPDLASHAAAVGPGTSVVHLLPTVLREIDKLKDHGRTEDARTKAQAVSRRLKGLRDKGVLADGVALTRSVTVRTEHREPHPPSVVDWLTAEVPDDRILASALTIQSAHPADTVVLVTSDMGLQTKADAARLPYVETPPSPASLRSRLSASVDYRPSREAPAGKVLVAVLTNVGSVTASSISVLVKSVGREPGDHYVRPSNGRSPSGERIARVRPLRAVARASGGRGLLDGPIRRAPRVLDAPATGCLRHGRRTRRPR